MIVDRGSDTNQVWKTANANAEPYDIVWHRITNGFGAAGHVGRESTLLKK